MAETIILDPIDGAAATNTVTNPSFEIDTAGWSVAAGGFIAAGTSITRVAGGTGLGTGQWAGRFVSSGSANSGVKTTLTGTFNSGTTYKVHVPVKAVSGTPSVTASVGISGTDSASSSSTPTNTTTWTDVTVSWTPSSNRTSVVLAILSPAAAVITVDLDQVLVSTVDTYFDGDTIGLTGATQYAWTGTPHASSSTRTPVRSQIDITAWVDVDGPDWGDAAIEAYLADTRVGSVPVDYRIPNRVITIPLNLRTVGATTFDQIRQSLATKAAMFQHEAGWIGRTSALGTVYADVVSATLKLGGDWFQANRGLDANAVLTLECLPDWYPGETVLDDNVEATNPELVTTLKSAGVAAVIRGDHPGRLRLVVDDDQGQLQRGLLWGLRVRYYSSAATAALAYDAEALTPLDAAATQALSGASGGSTIRHNALAASWTSVMSTQASGGGAHMTHTGTYRVWARVYTTSATDVQVRLVWDVGDLAYPTENDEQTIPGVSNFYMVDLGEVRLDRALQGAHRWQGVVQAQGQVGGENVYVDRLEFQPTAEFSGKLVASQGSSLITSYSSHDEFNQTSGALTGKTAPVGGVWTFSSGDTDDFQVDGAGGMARTTVSDTVGPRIVFPTSMASLTTTGASLDFAWTNGVPETWLIFRRVDSSNYGYVRLYATTIGGFVVKTLFNLDIGKVIAGTPTVLTSLGAGTAVGSSQPWAGMVIVQAVADTVSASVTAPGGARVLDPNVTATVTDSAFSGTLASGKVGIADYNSTATASSRTYDNFAAWVPVADAVMYASQSVEIRTDGFVREDSTGSGWGPVSLPAGDLPRIPPSGLENRPVELFVKASRGDFASIADSGIDDVSVRAFYRPSWLFVAGS